MKTYHDYESFWRAPEIPCPVMEAFRGTDIVRWYGQIETSVLDNIEKYEAARNTTYVDNLRAFLKIWRDNKIDGSINRETLEVLLAAAEVESVNNWDLDKYFRSLRDSLRVLIASEEELPRIGQDGAGGPGAGGLGIGGGAKPPKDPTRTSEFGPEDKLGDADNDPAGDQPSAPGEPQPGSPDNAGTAVDTAINRKPKV